jgi:hypothetical protein
LRRDPHRDPVAGSVGRLLLTPRLPKLDQIEVWQPGKCLIHHLGRVQSGHALHAETVPVVDQMPVARFGYQPIRLYQVMDGESVERQRICI